MNPPNPPADPNFIILYVESPSASAAFYAALLGRPPVESSPNFAMFSLTGGVMLGLWARHDVEPAAVAAGGGAEIGFVVGDRATVEARHAEWQARGLRILQVPVAMDFGYTFTAADPDGHRLRVFVPAAG
ncbi:MAG: VOC family protein [Opitutae bacterium]|nr:VOC family protein [Opitutae bacterium]